MPDSFFCFCAFLHKSIRLTFAIANLLQFAVTLQFRLQTSCNLRQPYNSDCKPSASLRQPCNSDCKSPAICGNLAIPIADLLQFAATLQFRLQTSCNLRQPCNSDCKPPAICSNFTPPLCRPPLSTKSPFPSTERGS